MNFKVKRDEPKELDLEFDTSDLTIPDLVAHELQEMASVEFAGVSRDHPETGKAVLVIRSKRKAKDDLIKALESIEEKVSGLKLHASKKK